MGFLDAFKKFPIKVVILTRYNNVLAPKFDKGRYEKQRLKTMDGFIENNYLMLKKTKVKIPAPEISFYYEKDNKREIWLMQLDRETFYPISFKNKEITFAYDAIGVDAEGKPIIDEKTGRAKIVKEERPFFNSTIAFSDGKIIDIPNPVTHKTYDKEHFLSDEIETSSRLYRSKSFWDRYGNLVILGVSGILIVMLLYVGGKNIADMTAKASESLAQVAQMCSGSISAPVTTPVPPPF